MIKKITSAIAYFTFPLMFLLMVLAKPIFLLLYSEKWLSSVPYFQVLCLIGISSCLQAINTQTIAAIGKSKTMFKWTLIKRISGSSLIIGGLFIAGMGGLLCGAVLYNWFCYFVNIGLVSRHIGYHWKKQLIDLMPMFFVSLFAGLISVAIGYLCHLPIYLNGLLKLFVFITIYISWTWLYKPQSYQYVLSVFPSKYIFWKKS